MPDLILKFARVFLTACSALALTHATFNIVGVRGIVKGEGSFFASQARNCKQTVIQASSPLTEKQTFTFD